jgi:hypothetical protein
MNITERTRKELHARADGLVNEAMLLALKTNARGLSIDLMKEGFNFRDINDYLNSKVSNEVYYTVDQTTKTKQVSEIMTSFGKFDWTHDWGNIVTTRTPYGDLEIDITFGHNNETWGASVWTVDGADIGYIETNLLFIDHSPSELAYASQRAVDEQLDKLVKDYLIEMTYN